jgi:50S ribosomal subunit-associated GTPase HflX
MKAVDAILQDLDLAQVGKLVVFNKTDRLGNGSDWLASLTRRYGAVAVSALRGEGLDRLVETADRLLGEPLAAVQLLH